MAIDWGAVLGALAQYWGGRGSSGDTPNFYNVPMSPEDKAWDDRRKALYDSGGSEQMKAVGSAAQQFFGGMPTTANPTYASPFMRNQPFAGGIQLPKIDLSRFDFSAKPPTGTGGGTTPTPPKDDPSSPGTWPRGGGEGGVYGGSWGPLPPTAAAPSASERWNQFTNWWAQYRRDHPDWATQGLKTILGAAAGVFGGPLASMLVRAVFSSDNPSNPGDAAAQRFEQFYTGTYSGGGSAYGNGQRPPGFGGTTPASGVGVTGGRNTGFEGFGAPGSMGIPYGNEPGYTPRTGMFNPTPPASGVGVGGSRNTGFEGFGSPGSVTPRPEPPKPPAYWDGYSTPYWNDPFYVDPNRRPVQPVPNIARTSRNQRS